MSVLYEEMDKNKSGPKELPLVEQWESLNQQTLNFLKANDGLARRLKLILHMQDYSDEELGKITRRKLHLKRLYFPASADFEKLFGTIPKKIKCTHNSALVEMFISEAHYKMEERLEVAPEVDDLVTMSTLTNGDLRGGMEKMSLSSSQPSPSVTIIITTTTKDVFNNPLSSQGFSQPTLDMYVLPIS